MDKSPQRERIDEFKVSDIAKWLLTLNSHDVGSLLAPCVERNAEGERISELVHCTAVVRKNWLK